MDEKKPDTGAGPHATELAHEAWPQGTMTQDYKRNDTATLFAAAEHPQLRSAAITTDMPLIPTMPVSFGADDFCQ